MTPSESQPSRAIRDRQLAWATAHGLQVDADGYTKDLNANLIQPISDAARLEFTSGGGGELGCGKRGKMQALHSSSALAYSVFDHWRGRDLAALEAALTALCPIPSRLTDMALEQVFPTGLSGTPPTLDVALSGADGWRLAIECKFSEPYDYAHRTLRPFSEGYFSPAPGRWAAKGLSKCQALAQAVKDQGIVFHRLDAPQLLKHVLGLAETCPNGFALLYLWYDSPAQEAAVHKTEIDLFSAQIGCDIPFYAATYQRLFAVLSTCRGVDADYLDYLRERYF